MKKILLIGLLFSLSIFLTGCFGGKDKVKEKVDLVKVEAEFNEILLSQQEKAAVVGKLADEGKVDETMAAVEGLREDLRRALELNQIMIDAFGGEKKEAFILRAQLLEDSISLYDKLEECLGLMDNQQAFTACQQELQTMSQELQTLGAEVKTKLDAVTK